LSAATLTRAGQPADAAVEPAFEQIIATWGRATARDVEAGARWYADAGAMVDSWAVTVGLGREYVAAVFAHLSPRTTWSRNVRGATLLLTTGQAPGCLGANVRRARQALASSDPLATLTGPKTARFARNLLGDPDVVTVDVWAARVAFGGRPDATVILYRRGMYAAVEHAYRLAAAQAGVPPATMQATTWIIARGSAG
jgi:hypothetical protein